MYRLYNPYTGERFYIANTGERDIMAKAGWRKEGIGWYSDAQQTVSPFPPVQSLRGHRHAQLHD